MCVCVDTHKQIMTDSFTVCHHEAKRRVSLFFEKLSLEKFLSLCTLSEIMSHFHSDSFLDVKHRQQVVGVKNESTTLSISVLFTSVQMPLHSLAF